MNEEQKTQEVYEAPKLVEYGDITRLTASANACASGIDALYHQGFNGVCISNDLGS